jgi:hypothetical protein
MGHGYTFRISQIPLIKTNGQGSVLGLPEELFPCRYVNSHFHLLQVL